MEALLSLLSRRVPRRLLTVGLVVAMIAASSFAGSAPAFAAGLPVAEDDVYRMTSLESLTVSAAGVLGNDHDADGDPLSAVLDTDVAHGVLALNGDGSLSYTSSPGYNQTDTFSYHANDGTGDSNIATVTILAYPTIHVDPQHDRIAGFNWTAGGSVTIQIDDDDDPGSWLYEWTGIEVRPTADVWFDVPYDFGPGQYVRMIDEASSLPTKETQVNPLTITEPVAAGGHTLSGTGDETIDHVAVSIHEPGEWVDATFVGSSWTATFSQTFTPGMYLSANQIEPGVHDGDATEIWVQIPDPRINLDPEKNSVWGGGWSEGTVDIAVTGGPTWTGVPVVTYGPPGYFELDLNTSSPTYDLVAGDVVTVTQGVAVKDHMVFGLVLSGVDPDSETIWGTTDAVVSDVDVWINDGSGGPLARSETSPGMTVTPTGSGPFDWTADFAGVADIGPYTQPGSNQCDSDGDCTFANWIRPPRPAIQVVPVGDYVDLLEFAPGPVSVTVNGTALNPAPDGGNGDVRVSLADYGIDLVAGDVVVASQGDRVAEVTTVHVEITAADPTTGIVSGLAPDGALVNVAAWTDNGGAERVTTAIDGAFSVNFSIQGGPDDPEPNIVTLTPGSGMAAWVYDIPHTGDASKHDWQVPYPPHFMVDVVTGRVFGYSWTPGSWTRVSVNAGPAVAQQVDGEGHFVVADPVTVAAGDVVRVSSWDAATGGTRVDAEKTHTVTGLTVTGVSELEDTISGTATPGAWVQVLAGGSGFDWRGTFADENGYWIVDFQIPWEQNGFPNPRDLQLGDRGFAEETDDDFDSTNASWSVAGPPTADAGGPYLVAVGQDVTFDGSSSTGSYGDSLTYAWNAEAGTFLDPDLAMPTYTAPDDPGIYDVCLTVNDGSMDSAEACTYAVVYDPSAGFVTGGGWFNSPEGAYVADESLTGKATFGFVSKYKRGASVPDGNTEFQFKAGDLNFHSSSYDWLVVTGANYARFKGTGTINGAGEYKFMIWAGDGSPDTFRIKIWTEDGIGVETIVYDNDADQPLGGGSIVIHTK